MPSTFNNSLIHYISLLIQPPNHLEYGDLSAVIVIFGTNMKQKKKKIKEIETYSYLGG